MSVNDSLPWIDDELHLIRTAHKNKLPILGHCLGSQLISKALGGKVTPMNTNEIGWHPIKFMNNKTAIEWQGKIPAETKIMLWHHDEFSIPPGATPLYTTPHCKNQAFVIDNVLATVAHIEVSETMLLDWLAIYGHDIEPNGGSMQTTAQIKQHISDDCRRMHILSDTFYLKWLKSVYPQDTNPEIYYKINSYLRTGSCLCNGVSFFLKRPRGVVNCHCLECRKFHGNYAAFTKVKHDDMCIFGQQHLGWYRKSKAQRGFCKTCASSLFWKKDGDEGICVAASSLDSPTTLTTIANIYVEEASDFYQMDKSLDAYSSTMKGTLPIKTKDSER